MAFAVPSFFYTHSGRLTESTHSTHNYQALCIYPSPHHRNTHTHTLTKSRIILTTASPNWKHAAGLFEATEQFCLCSGGLTHKCRHTLMEKVVNVRMLMNYQLLSRQKGERKFKLDALAPPTFLNYPVSWCWKRKTGARTQDFWQLVVFICVLYTQHSFFQSAMFFLI